MTTPYTALATTTLTIPSGTHRVLVIGQFTAQSTTNAGDVFARVSVDGTIVDGIYYSNLGSTAPGAGAARATIPTSVVVSMSAGTHTIALQGAYYSGLGVMQVIAAYARRLSVIDLG